MMKRFMILAAFAMALAVSSVSASATAYYFTPNPSDLNELTHQEAYRWGINLSIPSTETITSASLSFRKIYDWQHESNRLYCSLLNNKPGVPFGPLKVFTDNEAVGNYFNSWAWGKTDLHTYTNLSTCPTDITYNFTPGQLTALQSYLSDGNCAIAIDPDCHFYNCGIKLTIETECLHPPSSIVPEPSTLVLVLAGLAMAGGGRFLLRRRK
jgi:hypothetical protein